MNIISTSLKSFSNELKANTTRLTSFLDSSPFKTAVTTTAKALVRPNKNPQFPGNNTYIDGFYFDVVDEDSITLQSDITDHYSEDNSPLQDHIAIKPEIISVKGSISELKANVQTITTSASNSVRTFNPIANLCPAFSMATQTVLNTISRVETQIKNATKVSDDLYSMYSSIIGANTSKSTKQTQAFEYFYNLWQSKEIFSIITPWKSFDNMAIEMITITQGDTRSVSEMVIRFKKMRFTSTLSYASSAGFNSNMLSPAVNNQIRSSQKLLKSAAAGIADRTGTGNLFKKCSEFIGGF
jgi:hypothetical protein